MSSIGEGEDEVKSPLIAGKSRFQVNFVEPDSSDRDRSDDHDRSDTVDSQTPNNRSTFQYKNFNTLDFAPKTAFYRNTNNDARPTMAEIRAGRMPKAETPKIKTELGDGPAQLKLGWIQGVLVRCLLNIWGVMLFIRISWVIGQAGIAGGIGIIMLSSVVTTVTSISLAAICTNGEVKGGGAYYLISRSLGPEFGGAIGILFSIANAIAVAMYIVGFTETLVLLLEEEAGFSLTGNPKNDMRVWGLITLLILFGISMAGMAWESKAQVVLLVLLLLAMVNLVVGTFIRTEGKTAQGFYGYNAKILEYNLLPHFTEGENFFSVFSVFFPAATGIMAGANISGDLKDPSNAIPKGTLIAIALSTVTYVLFGAQAGATTLLSATGTARMPEQLPTNLTAAQHCIFQGVQKECKYGLLNSFGAMQMMSGYSHIITVGIFAATLSSALASLVSAPKVFQAVCKDKLFPYIGWFAKGFGANNEPWRAYILAMVIAAAFVCIAELNAIAPIITNFFLISYTLINYSCFESSFSKSPGWRPSYKYYNTWVSLLGTFICAAVMFVTSWWTALITVVAIIVLYRYIQYRKPQVNWGSSKQALKYNKALEMIHEISGGGYHVKNYRPQFLALTGTPSSRPHLVTFVSDISKGYGVMMCGHVVRSDTKVTDLQIMSEDSLLHANKIRAFHLPIIANSFRNGVKNLLQNNGLGSIKANTLLMGYKHSWTEESPEAVEDYVGVIKDAFDHNYAVAVLKFAKKLDIKSLSMDDVLKIDRSEVNGEIAEVNNGATAESDNNSEKPAENKSTEDLVDKKSEVDLEMGPIKTKVESPVPEFSFEEFRFTEGKPKGTIDVYWMSDDGGLLILLPYLLRQSKFWANTHLRVFAPGDHQMEMDQGKKKLATLLHKFRIDFVCVELVSGLQEQPKQERINRYMEYKPEEEGVDMAVDEKTKQYIRIGELIEEKTTPETQLIVVTMPVPRDSTPAAKYMSWLEAMSAGLTPPVLLLRGNQRDALTFYC